MSDPFGSASTRAVRWWVRRYTAGLHALAAAVRRAEIDSDVSEHERFRRSDGWSDARIARERITRALAGVPADIAWRHDRLRSRPGLKGFAALVAPTATLAQLALAVYFFTFAAYLLGITTLADQQILGISLLGGFEHYADEPGAATAALVVGSLGLALAVAAVARPISPVIANAVSLPIATLAVMFFWLGVWPLGVVVVATVGLDLALRSPQPASG